MRSVPLFQLRLAGYGLLVIGLINLLLRNGFSIDAMASTPGRLTVAHGLAGFAPWLLLSLALIFVQGNRQRRAQEGLPLALLHRLLLPLVVGYLLLIPLMVRDAIGLHRSVEDRINSEVLLYRSGSSRLQERIRPLGTSLEVVRVLQQYPNISVVADPTDSAASLRQKLAEALRTGEAQLRGRLEDLRRTRSEGLAQRTVQSSLICLVVAGGLGVLRLQNLALIMRSGERPGVYFNQDLLPIAPRPAGIFRGRRNSGSTYPHGWLGIEIEDQETSGPSRGS